jgi:transposase
MRPNGSASELERRRRRAIALLDRGLNPSEVADRVGADPSSVRRWRQAYRRKGVRGLESKPHPGRPSRLTPRQKRSLERRLLRGAQANGFDSDLWTCPRIAEVIEYHYGVEYHVDHIPRLLASLGWSCQRPEKRAIERDEQAIAEWVKKDWPRIKKSRA